MATHWPPRGARANRLLDRPLRPAAGRTAWRGKCSSRESRTRSSIRSLECRARPRRHSDPCGYKALSSIRRFDRRSTRHRVACSRRRRFPPDWGRASRRHRTCSKSRTSTFRSNSQSSACIRWVRRRGGTWHSHRLRSRHCPRSFLRPLPPNPRRRSRARCAGTSRRPASRILAAHALRHRIR
jgi:hypothetical protein